MRFALIFSLALAVLAVIFALQNPQMIEVNLLFVETQGSAALVLIVTFAIGVVVGLLSTLPGRLRDRRQVKQMKKQMGSGSSPKMPSTPSSPSASDMPSPSSSSSSSSSSPSAPSSLE